MSSISRSRRGRVVGGRGRGNRRRRPVEQERSESDQENTDPADRMNGGDGCIDLTEEDDDIIFGPQIVDLTSPVQPAYISTRQTEPIVITGIVDAPAARSPRGRRRRGRTSQLDSPRRQRPREAASLLSSDSDSGELPDIDLPSTPYKPPEAQAGTSGTYTASPLSPEGVPLSCPICMDSANRIRISGRQLHSTTCGHIFCNECIKNSIKAQNRCPTCRKKLTVKQTHPIFL